MESWQQILRTNFTKVERLSEFLQLEFEPVHTKFPLNIPFRLAQKIEKQNRHDPILRQFLPLTQEYERNEGFGIDPVGDVSARASGKLLHKYEGRALLMPTSACAMHCRYCFRREFDYETEVKGLEKEFEILSQDTSIDEIILSGGDPLSLSNTQLQNIIAKLETIPHLKRVRFHTRFPIGIPERINNTFLEILAKSRFQFIFIIHTNHPRELDSDIFDALKKIMKLGIPVLNQSVLLKGVNDSVATLKELFELLVNHGILPYYLHQLDRVQGAAHFETPETYGIQLIEDLKKCLSGYAIPRYVREIAGEKSKSYIL
jgi:EF-P beta-lysylation protein EpmB